MPIVARGLPTPLPDNPNVGVANRGGRYGEQYVRNGDAGGTYWADEGAYRRWGNVIGTPIAASAATGFVATTPYIVIFNNNPVVGPNAASGANFYLDYIKLVVTTAGASGTAVAFVAQVDSGNRYSSGGTANVAAVNPNTNYPNTTGIVFNIGAITATAAVASRNVGQDETVRSTIIILNDKYLFDFAARGASMASSQAATLSNFYVPCSPVVLAPQTSFLLNLWMPSGAASSFNYEVTGWER